MKTSELHQRLSAQLQALSQVGEALTLRLLELEERLGGLESQLNALQLGEQEGADDEGNTQALLAATEQRLAHLEDLLREPGRLHVLPLQQKGSPVDEPEAELNPFPDEEEQPFMDELTA